ncbi:MAG: XRE family transcriptional regulator [Bacteroidetes bacterium]|nr:MAG: XRE family transcriptional regulator [Bacteroidota bacterium]
METQILGNNIKLFRERLGLSQENMAQYLGVKREMVSYYENGVRTPNVDILKKLADLFGVEEIELLEEASDTKTANMAFAFRAEGLNNTDLENIAKFKKIVKNYLKIVKLTR